MTDMHRHVLGLLLLLFLTLSHTATADDDPATVVQQPKNLILFVADGAGPAHFTMARELARHLGLRDHLYLDAYHRGSVQTQSASERVTDSASSATAYATGFKTYNAAIAVDTLRQPLRTVLEAAETDGMATGLVASSRITHATPASFAAHVPDRGMENEIAAQMIEQGIDVILGGGRRHFVPAEEGGARRDGRNLLEEARDLGYTFIGEADALASIHRGPVLGLLGDDHLPYEIDRHATPHVDLADMTRKALELLEEDDDGFFLLVEGSRIDHSSHDNDAATSLRELLAYDDAFEVARAFAERDGETLVIAVSDHETGGLSAGRSMPPADVSNRDMSAPTYLQSLYGGGVYDWRPDVLARVRSSTAAMVDSLGRGKDARSVLRDGFGIADPRHDELAAVATARATGSGLIVVLGEILARRALVGWTTTGHTAVDVNLYSLGPGSETLHGHIDNTHIGRVLFEHVGAEMGTLSSSP